MGEAECFGILRCAQDDGNDTVKGNGQLQLQRHKQRWLGEKVRAVWVGGVFRDPSPRSG